MKATTPLLSMLAASVLAVGALALDPSNEPVVQRREAWGEGVHLQVRTVQDFNCVPTIFLHVELTNHSGAPVELPSVGPEPGLDFLLVDSQGTLLDGKRQYGIMTVNLLGPGETVSSRIDLGRRPLVRVEEGSFAEIAKYDGLFDPAFDEEPFVDLHLYQTVGDELLEVEPIRLVLRPPLMEKRAKFEALHTPATDEWGDITVDPNAGADLKIWDPTNPIMPDQDFVPGRILVTFLPHADLAQAMLAVESEGYIIGNTALFDKFKMLSVLVPEGEEKVAEFAFSRLRVVAHASLDYIARIM